MKIVKHGPQLWENLHCTFTQQLTDLYDLGNESHLSKLEAYKDTTKGIQKIMGECATQKVSLRALGGCWSLSPVMATDGILLNTRYLNMSFPVSTSSVHQEYSGTAKDLFFVQCGTAIWELNERLNAPNIMRSLKTCGASNGQSIVGAMSTGTHGSAVDTGSIQDYVVGIHLITGPHSHVFLQRKSRPVINSQFAEKLEADLLEDDDLFHAAQVSLGSLGFIHGVLIETEPIYVLESYMRRFPFDSELFQLMTQLDFKHPLLPYPQERPFQFQVMVNPYDLQKGVRVTTMYKRPFVDHEPPSTSEGEIGPGDDAPTFIGKLTDVAPALVPVVVNGLLASSLKPYEKKVGTLAEIFSNFNIRGKVASAAVGVDSGDSIKALKILLALNESHGPFVGLFACRFVKKSDALLAFTRFPYTCIIELDGILSKKSLQFYKDYCNALEQQQISFTYHWGKINELNQSRVEKMYGENLLKFQKARALLLDEHMRITFNNPVTKDWGLDDDRQTRGIRSV